MVRQVGIPPSARSLTTLPRVDYADAFLVDTGPSRGGTAEQWARRILEDAPAVIRHRLWWSWLALGLRLGSPQADRLVLGWEVRRTTPTAVVLGARSRLGMPAELVVERRAHALSLATFVQQRNALARALWALVARRHREVVPYLLERGVRDAPGSRHRDAEAAT